MSSQDERSKPRYIRVTSFALYFALPLLMGLLGWCASAVVIDG